jgi:phthiocerol/phenolphthiocerol synthesis type-I polyketide synthase E
VTGEEAVLPLGAIALGPCLVGGVEYPNVVCRLVDVSRKDLPNAKRRFLVERLIEDMLFDLPSTVVAYRNANAWVPMLERVDLDLGDGATTGLYRSGGAYLITGGLGALGLAVARSMANRAASNFVLVSRSALPTRDRWTEYLANAAPHDKAANIIRQIVAIEEMGADVMIAAADVGDLSSMALFTRPVWVAVSPSCRRTGR